MNRRKKIAAVSVVCLIAAVQAKRAIENAKKKKTKKWWIRPSLQHRAKSGFYATLRSQLSVPGEHQKFLRMSLEDFDFLVERLTPRILKKDTKFRKAIAVDERLAVTLYYLASGDSYASLMSTFLLGKTTICHIIEETCCAIFEALKEEYLKLPSSVEEWTEIADKFNERWNFPNCCGAMEGKYVMSQASANSAPEYGNYNTQNSIVVMALVDAEYKFLFVECGPWGQECGSDVFANCALATALAENTINFPQPRPLPGGTDSMPFAIIADDAFPLRSYLLKPFPRGEQVMSKQIFNYRVARAMNVAENAFGICASRFRILRKPIDVQPDKAKAIVLATCVLHNFLITRKSIYLTKADLDDYIEGTLIPGSWRSEVGKNGILASIRPSSRTDRSSEFAIYTRSHFMEYFMTPHGELSWQYNRNILQN